MNTFSCKFVENLPASIYCFYFHDWRDEKGIICLIYHRVKNQECAGGGAVGRCQVTTAKGVEGGVEDGVDGLGGTAAAAAAGAAAAAASRTLFLFSQFTNCSACRHRASAGKCKVAQLPRDLAVHVKVGDDYKMVCILPAWEIKRLAPTVRPPLAAALLPSCLFPFTPPPFPHFAA